MGRPGSVELPPTIFPIRSPYVARPAPIRRSLRRTPVGSTLGREISPSTALLRQGFVGQIQAIHRSRRLHHPPVSSCPSLSVFLFHLRLGFAPSLARSRVVRSATALASSLTQPHHVCRKGCRSAQLPHLQRHRVAADRRLQWLRGAERCAQPAQPGHGREHCPRGPARCLPQQPDVHRPPRRPHQDLQHQPPLPSVPQLGDGIATVVALLIQHVIRLRQGRFSTSSAAAPD